jgi:hypothetical protein
VTDRDAFIREIANGFERQVIGACR